MIVIDRLLASGPVELVDPETNWRCAVAPGQSIAALPQSVQDAIAAHWTEPVVAAYQASLALEDTLPTVPLAVSPRQARQALTQAGLRTAVEAWVAGQDQDIQDAWDYAIEIRRDDALIAAAGAALELTEQQIDELFALAATL